MGGTAIRHSTRCAGRRGRKRPRDGRHNSCCAWWQYHPLQRRPYRGQFLYPDMHHGTCMTHVPCCMPGSLTSGFHEVGGGKNVPGIPGACATHNFAYLVRGPCPLKGVMIDGTWSWSGRRWRDSTHVSSIDMCINLTNPWNLILLRLPKDFRPTPKIISTGRIMKYELHLLG